MLARLVHMDIKPAPASRLVLARQMTAALAAALPGHDLHVVADAAYAGKELARLPASVTWTTRLRKDAALHELPGPRTGRRGRPRVKGKRLPSLDALAGKVTFTPVTVRRYGKTATSTPPPSPACGTASPAPGPSRSCWSATAPAPATTWLWPPPA